jgi:hypothetical protein
MCSVGLFMLKIHTKPLRLRPIPFQTESIDTLCDGSLYRGGGVAHRNSTTYIGQSNKEKSRNNIHVSSGIRTHDPSVRTARSLCIFDSAVNVVGFLLIFCKFRSPFKIIYRNSCELCVSRTLAFIIHNSPERIFKKYNPHVLRLQGGILSIGKEN